MKSTLLLNLSSDFALSSCMYDLTNSCSRIIRFWIAPETYPSCVESRDNCLERCVILNCGPWNLHLVVVEHAQCLQQHTISSRHLLDVLFPDVASTHTGMRCVIMSLAVVSFVMPIRSILF